jgi:hypothetical protein
MCTYDRQCTYRRHIEARSLNHCRRETAIIITHSECVSVALFIQHAMRMRCILSVASVAPPYFSTLRHKRQDFRNKKVTEQISVF